jgi:hypothetical protein
VGDFYLRAAFDIVGGRLREDYRFRFGPQSQEASGRLQQFSGDCAAKFFSFSKPKHCATAKSHHGFKMIANDSMKPINRIRRRSRILKILKFSKG